MHGEAGDWEALLFMQFLNQPDEPELHGILLAFWGEERERGREYYSTSLNTFGTSTVIMRLAVLSF